MTRTSRNASRRPSRHLATETEGADPIELVPLPEIVVPESEDEEELEPWQGELTEEDLADMAEQGLSEEEYRMAKAEDEAVIDDIFGGMDAWNDAARAAGITIPKVLRDRRLEVDNAIYGEIGDLITSGDWSAVERFATEQAAIYPESRAYLERAWARAMSKRYADALADVRIAAGVESLEIREDRLRPQLQSVGFADSRLVSCQEFEQSLARIVADTPSEADRATLDALALASEHKWIEAHAAFLRGAPGPQGGAWIADDPYFSDRAKSEFVSRNGVELCAALVTKGRALLASEDEAKRAEAHAIAERLGSLYAPYPEKDVFRGDCATARGDTDTARSAYRGALWNDVTSSGANLGYARILEAEGDTANALLHYAAGAGPIADAAQAVGAAKECAAARERLEAAKVPATTLFNLYLDPTNAVLSSKDRVECAAALGGIRRLGELGAKPLEVHRFSKNLYHRVERYAEAVAACDALLALPDLSDDDKYGAYDIEASSLRALERHAEAIPLYESMIALRPDDLHPVVQLGFTYYLGVEDLDRAFELFTKAIDAGTTDPFVYMERAEILAKREKWSEAADDASKASTIASEQGRTGLVLRASNSAVQWSEKALEELFKNF
ncbi:MAG: hypothetical protein R3F34_09785 [Planctomycetota bacterium]